MDVKLPIDLPQRPQFRTLRDCFGRPLAVPSATYVYFILYQELCYHAKNGARPGVLPRAGIPSFAESLATGGILDRTGTEKEKPETQARQEAFEALMAKLVNPVGLLIVQGDDFFCPDFAQANPDADFRSRSQRGGDARAYGHRTKHLGTKVAELSLNLSPEIFKDAAGEPLQHAQVERLTKLIYLCDSALFLQERQPYAYEPALIQNGLALLAKYTDAQIDQACRKIMLNRHHPYLTGIGTDKLLADFGALVESLP